MTLALELNCCEYRSTPTYVYFMQALADLYQEVQLWRQVPILLAIIAKNSFHYQKETSFINLQH